MKLLIQDAKKGVLFIDFPPVLQLQLKRFEYDFMRDTMVKVSSRFGYLTIILLMILPVSQWLLIFKLFWHYRWTFFFFYIYIYIFYEYDNYGFFFSSCCWHGISHCIFFDLQIRLVCIFSSFKETLRLFHYVYFCRSMIDTNFLFNWTLIEKMESIYPQTPIELCEIFTHSTGTMNAWSFAHMESLSLMSVWMSYQLLMILCLTWDLKKLESFWYLFVFFQMKS